MPEQNEMWGMSQKEKTWISPACWLVVSYLTENMGERPMGYAECELERPSNAVKYRVGLNVGFILTFTSRFSTFFSWATTNPYICKYTLSGHHRQACFTRLCLLRVPSANRWVVSTALSLILTFAKAFSFSNSTVSIVLLWLNSLMRCIHSLLGAELFSTYKVCSHTPCQARCGAGGGAGMGKSMFFENLRDPAKLAHVFSVLTSNHPRAGSRCLLSLAGAGRHKARTGSSSEGRSERKLEHSVTGRPSGTRHGAGLMWEPNQVWD